MEMKVDGIRTNIEFHCAYLPMIISKEVNVSTRYLETFLSK